MKYFGETKREAEALEVTQCGCWRSYLATTIAKLKLKKNIQTPSDTPNKHKHTCVDVGLDRVTSSTETNENIQEQTSNVMDDGFCLDDRGRFYCKSCVTHVGRKARHVLDHIKHSRRHKKAVAASAALREQSSAWQPENCNANHILPRDYEPWLYHIHALRHCVDATKEK
jgi:hypothetical protein